MSIRLRSLTSSSSTSLLTHRSSLSTSSTSLLLRSRTPERMSLPREERSSLVRTTWLSLPLRSYLVTDPRTRSTKSTLNSSKPDLTLPNLTNTSLVRSVSSSLKLIISTSRRKLRLRSSKCQPRPELNLHATSG